MTFLLSTLSTAAFHSLASVLQDFPDFLIDFVVYKMLTTIKVCRYVMLMSDTIAFIVVPLIQRG